MPESQGGRPLSVFGVGHYRAIGGIELRDIAPVNLIIGPNGIGKTSLLEALWLFHGRANPGNLWTAIIQREQGAVTDPITRLAHEEIHISGTEAGEQHDWKASFSSTWQAADGVTPGGNGRTNGEQGDELPAPVAGFLRIWLDGIKQKCHRDHVMTTPRGLVQLPVRDANHERGILVSAINVLGVAENTIKEFGKLVEAGGKHELIEDLRFVLPRIRDIETVMAESGSPYLLATTDGNTRLPLQALGGGIVRLFHALVAMRMAKAGMILLDEVEIGLHHTALPGLWRCIRSLAKDLNVQVFTSTHSLECVDAAVSVFEKNPDDLAVHSLRSRADSQPVGVATFRGETLLEAREINLELR